MARKEISATRVQVYLNDPKVAAALARKLNSGLEFGATPAIEAFGRLLRSLRLVIIVSFRRGLVRECPFCGRQAAKVGFQSGDEGTHGPGNGEQAGAGLCDRGVIAPPQRRLLLRGRDRPRANFAIPELQRCFGRPVLLEELTGLVSQVRVPPIRAPAQKTGGPFLPVLSYESEGGERDERSMQTTLGEVLALPFHWSSQARRHVGGAERANVQRPPEKGTKTLKLGAATRIAEPPRRDFRQINFNVRPVFVRGNRLVAADVGLKRNSRRLYVRIVLRRLREVLSFPKGTVTDGLTRICLDDREPVVLTLRR